MGHAHIRKPPKTNLHHTISDQINRDILSHEIQKISHTLPKPPKAPKEEENFSYFSHFRREEGRNLQSDSSLWLCPRYHRPLTTTELIASFRVKSEPSVYFFQLLVTFGVRDSLSDVAFAYQ